jgi:hypothetical protein
MLFKRKPGQQSANHRQKTSNGRSVRDVGSPTQRVAADLTGLTVMYGRALLTPGKKTSRFTRLKIPEQIFQTYKIDEDSDAAVKLKQLS